MNSSFIERQANALAERVVRDSNNLVQKQIISAYQFLFQRTVSAEEFKTAKAFIKEHGLEEFCLVLLNTNEFLHVD